ncbi:MAG: SirB1 family protein [Armatimonadota bacterium]
MSLLSAEAAREELLQLLRDRPSPFPYDEAALRVEAFECSSLDPGPSRRVLNELAAAAAIHAPDAPGPRERLAALGRALYEDGGLRGDRELYYDLSNSLLSQVLERRRGIPISLAAVVLGVSRRLEWSVYPVNFPAHFLVAAASAAETAVLDPFDGLLLGPEELGERWRLATGEEPPPPAGVLEPADPAGVVVRMLNNIRMLHVREQRYEEAARTTELVARIDSSNPLHQRDLALLYLRAGDRERAAEHLETYVERCPEGPDVPALRRHLGALRSRPEA